MRLLILLLLISNTLYGQSDIGDQLIKSTVRIIKTDKANKSFVGTGFFFEYCPDTTWNKHIEVIVTNKHVVKDAKSLTFNFRAKSQKNSSGQKTIRTYKLENPLNWIFNHPNPNVDLCIIFIKPITSYYRNTYNETLDLKSFSSKLIPTKEVIDEISSIEDVIMIGYPKGITDPNSFYPIVRKGITATSYKEDFNGKKEFVTDMFNIGGSSGSPIILFRKGYFPTNESQLNQFVNAPYLLGIHYAGLGSNSINLGLNVKSFRITEILDEFVKIKMQDPKQVEWVNKIKSQKNK